MQLRHCTIDDRSGIKVWWLDLAMIPKNETTYSRDCVPNAAKDPCTRIVHPIVPKRVRAYCIGESPDIGNM